nr:hypothetical protein [Tanacetum cinerariifolium]
DYLKACGIVQQLTPPYTPQHNDVSERRDHTLLHVVRSMMNLTTLPLSFWDYALEAAACILNMVPTKKVDKTPYVLCEIPREVEGFEPPQKEEAYVRRSEMPHRAPGRLCLNVEVEEHSLEDLNELANYKTALLDPESNKWLDAMNAEMQSMKDNQNPGELYWTAVKIILKYLRNTKDMFLVYGGNPEAELRVKCYCDAEAWMEAFWIRKFIPGLGIVPTINEPIMMFCDNSATLHFTNELGVQKGTRHFRRKYHYVRECIKLGEIKFLTVHTDDNLADPFTKALSKKKLT